MKRLISIIATTLLYITVQAQSSIDRNQVMDYLQEQQYDQMISYLQPVANSIGPKDLALLAYAYHQSGRLKDAVLTYEHILSLDSNAIAARQNLAGIQMQQNQHQKALLNYKHLLQLRPGNPFLWKQLSSAAYALGQADSGLIWLNRAYQLNPVDERVVEKLAEHWIAKKEYEVADSVIGAYLQSDSLNATMLQLAVKTAYLRKNYKRAAQLGGLLRMQQVVSPAAFTYVTAACYQLKRYKDCIAVYEYLDQNKVSSENITYYAALACTGLGEFKRSNALLQDCITMAKSDMLEIYYHCTSQNYESLKQYKPALASLDTSYYLSHRILRLYSMGRIQEMSLSNMPAAMKFYKRYVQLYKEGDPDEKVIYDYLKVRLKKEGH